MNYTVGIDIGTTNICVLLAEVETYNVVAVRSCKNNTLIPSDNPACFEQDAGIIVEKVLKLLAELVNCSAVEKSAITGIAVTGQMHGVVLIDAELKPVTPLYTWRDRRADEEGFLAGVLGKIPQNYQQRTGCSLAAGFGGLTLSWLLASEESRSRLASCKALTIMDYLVGVLSGRLCIDYSNAAGWGIYDIINNKWYGDMLEAMAIPEDMLPEIICSGEVAGYLTPVAAEKISLSERVKVYVPIGDNQASYYGAGKGRKGAAVINIGTSGQITVPSDSICVGAGLETRPLPNAGYILVGAILCGGWAYDYLAGFFVDVIENLGGISISKDTVYDNMKSLLQRYNVQKGAGINVVTRFSGTRSGIGRQRGSIEGIDEGNLRAGNLIYGFLQGIIVELAEMLPESYLAEGRIKEMIATGNAIRLNPQLLEIIGDVFSTGCVLSQVEEEAAAGAAFVAINNELGRV